MNTYQEDIDRILGTFPDVEKATALYKSNDLFHRIVDAMVNGIPVESILLQVLEIKRRT
jgi:hypothetical protein